MRVPDFEEPIAHRASIQDCIKGWFNMPTRDTRQPRSIERDIGRRIRRLGALELHHDPLEEAREQKRADPENGQKSPTGCLLRSVRGPIKGAKR